MWWRLLLIGGLCGWPASVAWSQVTGGAPAGAYSQAPAVAADPNAAAVAGNASAPASSPAAAVASSAGGAAGGGTGFSNASKMVELPNDAGQIWKEYDLAPYTSRVTDTVKPEQAVVDWILRETGTEVWFSQPLGILSATPNKLRVYHTPEMHEVVRDIYYRFVNSQAETQVLSLRMVTVDSPNWRALAYSMMTPVTVQSPGVEAWLLTKESAALLTANLSKRTDYREHNSPNVLIHNGQTHTLTRKRPKNYVRSANGQGLVALSPQLELGQIEEGYTLQVSPLMSLDGKTIDAVIKCEIDQVEKLVPITIDIPSTLGQMQRVQIQIPQLVSWRLHERFRWPADEVLLLSCGVVASPGAEASNPLGIPNLLKNNPLTNTTPGRADALLFIESKGKASQALLDAQRQPIDSAPNYRGRY
ncbi:MAG: hypothetical protein KDA55_05170 [Planctomycetales bacterium]|nr:hypothetical protein [Planctomycetales bacterium]